MEKQPTNYEKEIESAIERVRLSNLKDILNFIRSSKVRPESESERAKVVMMLEEEIGKLEEKMKPE